MIFYQLQSLSLMIILKYQLDLFENLYYQMPHFQLVFPPVKLKIPLLYLIGQQWHYHPLQLMHQQFQTLFFFFELQRPLRHLLLQLMFLHRKLKLIQRLSHQRLYKCKHHWLLSHQKIKMLLYHLLMLLFLQNLEMLQSYLLQGQLLLILFDDICISFKCYFSPSIICKIQTVCCYFC